MARIARIVVPEYPHHVTQRGVRSLPIFRDDEDRRSYLEFHEPGDTTVSGGDFGLVFDDQPLFMLSST